MMGVVVPHAGYAYSASGAAWAYAAMAADGRPGAAVMLGVNHRGVGAPLALSPARGWATPLGVMPVAHALSAQLQRLDEDLTLDEHAHRHEHSIEVQLPFLQILFGELPIIPISLGHASPVQLARLGHALAFLAAQHDIVCVASTDFSHYLPAREAIILDRLALQMIASIDPTGLLETVRAHHITMCGVLPVTAMLMAAQEQGIHAGQILHYHTSGDVTGEREAVVGYGTAVLSR
jgi:hypothetical protein